MNYYENHDNERADIIWNLFQKAILIIFIIIATIGYFTIDFEKIENTENRSVEENDKEETKVFCSSKCKEKFIKINNEIQSSNQSKSNN